MDFYNEAVKATKEQNIELSEICKELLLAISQLIQDMNLRMQGDFLKTLIDRWELD